MLSDTLGIELCPAARLSLFGLSGNEDAARMARALLRRWALRRERHGYFDDQPKSSGSSAEDRQVDIALVASVMHRLPVFVTEIAYEWARGRSLRSLEEVCQGFISRKVIAEIIQKVLVQIAWEVFYYEAELRRG